MFTVIVRAIRIPLSRSMQACVTSQILKFCMCNTVPKESHLSSSFEMFSQIPNQFRDFQFVSDPGNDNFGPLATFNLVHLILVGAVCYHKSNTGGSSLASAMVISDVGFGAAKIERRHSPYRCQDYES